MVHIVDVVESIRKFPILAAIAQERAFSVFSSSPPRHMLPLDCLRSLKLSSEHPNEVITVAFLPNAITGKIENFRVFPSVIGPVHPVTLSYADQALTSLLVDPPGRSNFIPTVIPGFQDQILKDLGIAYRIAAINSDCSHWLKPLQATASSTTSSWTSRKSSHKDSSQLPGSTSQYHRSYSIVDSF